MNIESERLNALEKDLTFLKCFLVVMIMVIIGVFLIYTLAPSKSQPVVENKPIMIPQKSNDIKISINPKSLEIKISLTEEEMKKLRPLDGKVVREVRDYTYPTGKTMDTTGEITYPEPEVRKPKIMPDEIFQK